MSEPTPQEQFAGADLVACWPVGHPEAEAEPGSVRGDCAECHEGIWVWPAAARARLVMDLRTVCVKCCAREVHAAWVGDKPPLCIVFAIEDE